MADSLKPPPLTNDLKDDDDEEDLFVSAVETKSKLSPDDGDDSTLKSHTTIEDMNGSIEEEIDLNAEDDATPEEPTSNGLGSPQPLFATPTLGNDSPSPLDNNKPTQDSAVLPAVIESKTEPMSAPRATASVPIATPQLQTFGAASKLPTKTETNGDSHFIEIKVEEPKRIGEGMKAYVVYRVSTKTNLPFFRRTELTVNRRFSDFRGLRDKLAEKHLHVGRIVPPAPEKDAVATAKVKYSSKEEGISGDDFIEKRRSSLERYLNRTARHPTLRADPDFREFLELDTDLPKATNTSALSGAGVRRLFNKMGDTVNKMTFRMDESEPNLAMNPVFNIEWFDEKQHQVENLDQQLRKLHASIEALLHHRRELTVSTGSFAKSAAMLGNAEEHTSLSCALSQLAETEEKVEQLYSEQVNTDFVYLSELIKDYVSLIGAVKDVFHQRVKVYQTWQHAQQMLNKKREAKAKLELAGRSDKVPAAQEEVNEWEAKVNRGQEEFENISKTIKQELELFEINRINDFKKNIIKYMENLLETQQRLITYWECFLPQAKAL